MPNRVTATRSTLLGCLLIRERPEVAIIPTPSRTSVAGSGTLAPLGVSSGVGAASSATNDAACSVLSCLLLSPARSGAPRVASNRSAVQPAGENSVVSSGTPPLGEQGFTAKDVSCIPARTCVTGSALQIPFPPSRSQFPRRKHQFQRQLFHDRTLVQRCR